MSAQDDRMEKRERKSKVHDRALLLEEPNPLCKWCGGTGWSNGRLYDDPNAKNLTGVTVFPCGCTYPDEQEDTQQL
jgi:hypothetical protein